MHWINIVPELILLTLIVVFQQAEPSFIVYLIYGLLYGAFLGAAWCTLLTVLGDLSLSKTKFATLGVMGTVPLVTAYLIFQGDFFTASGVDEYLFHKTYEVTTQEERDIILLAILGTSLTLVLNRVFRR